MKSKQRLLVIGNGMAGARAVEEILSRGGGDQFEITMFGDEPYGNYNRILLSNVLNGSQDAHDIFLNPLDWYSENGITLHAGVKVTTIDRLNKTITDDRGQKFVYDKLMIATGSRPFVPPINGIKTSEGTNKPGVFLFRTIDDCNQIAERAEKCKKAVVIGGGLLGLEAARGLMNYGLDVHIVHNMSWLMNNQLDPMGGSILKSVMQKMGVHVHLDKMTTKINGDKDVTGVSFNDETMIECQMVVISAGIRANSEIGTACGLTTNLAILTNDQMQSIDDPDIYVVGECAEHRGVVYGLVQPLWEQAAVLADHITGRKPKAAYLGSKLATKLKVMGVELATMGITEPADSNDEVVTFAEPKRGIYKKVIVRNDTIVGAMLLGDVSKASFLMQAFDRSLPVSEDRASLLFDLGGASRGLTMVEMPDEAQVCNCNGVSKKAIRKCVAAGNRSLKSIMNTTRAGMGCGSCKALVTEIVEWACEGQMDEDPSIHYYVPGVPLSKPQLTRAVMEQELKSVSSVFHALSDGIEDALSKPGLASLLRTLWGNDYVDERDARFINDRVHANIQRDATFSVIPQIPGGITSPDQLRKIADVADKFNVPMVKLTGGQRIDLLGIKKDDLPQVWKDLGMPSGYAYGKYYRTCKSCVGTDFCRFGLGDSTKLAIKIEARFQGLESPGKLKMATAGCPRNCSEAYVKDVGAVAIEGGLWEIYVGGAAGAHVRKGDLLCVLETHEEVLKITGRFVQYYRENAKYLERTYSFVPRIGIERIKAIVIDDSDGIASQLDAAMQESVDAYFDPWKEAYAPKTSNQFTSIVPTIQSTELTQVDNENRVLAEVTR